MSASPDPQVLVVLVNNHADWRRVVEEHWYRIPLRTAPQPVAASYLGFYQSRVFGADAFRIRFFAPVLRYQRLTRRELLPHEPQHPRAGEQYYRVELGALEELSRPVPSRRLRRITFIPTTLRRLCEADEINDLWMADDVEDLLWELFHDAGIKAERRLEIGEGRRRYVVPVAVPEPGATERAGLAIFCDLRPRPSYLGRWQVLRFAPGTIASRPERVVARVHELLKAVP
jgi:hypothetical protein